MTSDRSKPSWRDTVFELRVVAPRVLERIGYTLVLFASIAFSTVLAFVLLAALARDGSSYPIATVIDSLGPILAISTGALTGGIIAILVARTGPPAAGKR